MCAKEVRSGVILKIWQFIQRGSNAVQDGNLGNSQGAVMTQAEIGKGGSSANLPGGLAGWLMGKLQVSSRRQPRLALLERIALAPKQSLSLIEAEGRRFLVATSADGSPCFYPLDEQARRSGMSAGNAMRKGVRASW
jgi:hypothetical protein